MKKKAIPTEIIDKEGNLNAIEFHTEDGEHIIDAIWDINDPQDNYHRAKFRNWAYEHLERIDYDVQL